MPLLPTPPSNLLSRQGEPTDVIACRAPAAILTLLCLDSDGLRGADSLAELAGDAALLAGGVATQRVLAAEARTDGALLEGVIDLRSGSVS